MFHVFFPSFSFPWIQYDGLFTQLTLTLSCTVNKLEAGYWMMYTQMTESALTHIPIGLNF